MKIKMLIIMTTILVSNLQAKVDTVFVPYLGQVDIQFTFQLSKMNDRYLYNYQIHSFETSMQDIRCILIQYIGDCIYDISSPVNWFSFRGRVSPYTHSKKFIAWGPDDYAYMIKAGNSLEGFQISSLGLPFIGDYAVQGYFPTPSIEFGEEEPVIIGSMNIYENSKKGKIIGPACPPSPFIPTAFLDTLVSYTRQSKDLGWITEQAAAEKYEGYFTMAQNMLQQNRITETRAKLQEVLRDVEADSGAFLTSEAYALLRYNTEYLLSQISESEVTLNDLIAYIRKAQEEGKISPEGIANSLISKLEEAKKQLEKGKSKQAVNALNAFLNELSGQHQKHIADEVYGYLKEKVERLISQIESSG